MERYIQRNWLKQLTAKLVAEDKITSQTAQTINDEADATNDFALYKMFKSVYGLIGTFLVFAGLLVIFGDFIGDKEKVMCFIPGLIGGGGYFFYLSQKRTSKLWKELMVPLFMVSVGVSFPMILAAFEIDFINNKLIFYMILTFMLWLIYKHNTIVGGAIYLIILFIVGSLFSGITAMLPYGEFASFGRSIVSDDYSWLWILSWAYLIAIVPFLKYRLSDIGIKLGIKEAILSWLFVYAAYQFSFGMTAGFGGLGFLVVSTLLYMMSKRYYGQATWFFNRPGSTMLVWSAVISTLLFSNKAMGIGFSAYGFPDDIGLDQILSLLVILGIGLYAFKFYKDQIEPNGVQLNYILMAYPAVFFVAALIGSDGAYAVFTLYGIALFGWYAKEGLRMKYSPLVLLGVGFGVLFACIRIAINVLEKVMEEQSALIAGITLIFFGLIFLGSILYIKGIWSVSDDNVNPDDDNILDATIADVKNIDVKAVIDDVKDTVQNANKPSAPKAPPASQSPSAPETPSEPESNNNDSNDDSENGANDSDSSNDEPKTDS